ncbi:MAG: branched-chain amino acid ABC transporter permease, partial [Comamonas sp.]
MSSIAKTSMNSSAADKGEAQAHYRFKPLNIGRILIWGLFALALIVAPMIFTSSLALTMLSQIGYLIIICLS